MSIKDKKVFFGWINPDNDIEFYEEWDEIKKVLRDIRSKLIREDVRVHDAWDRGIIDPGSNFNCNGAFVIICDRSKETVIPTGTYYSGMDQLINEFNRDNAMNEAILVPLHMNFNHLDFELEFGNKIVEALINSKELPCSLTTIVDDFSSLPTKNIESLEFLVQNDEEKIDWQPFNKLYEIMHKFNGWFNLLVRVNIKLPDCSYNRIIFNSINDDNVGVVNEVKRIAKELNYNSSALVLNAVLNKASHTARVVVERS